MTVWPRSTLNLPERLGPKKREKLLDIVQPKNMLKKQEMRKLRERLALISRLSLLLTAPRLIEPHRFSQLKCYLAVSPRPEIAKFLTLLDWLKQHTETQLLSRFVLLP
jgi:hypothetical protein